MNFDTFLKSATNLQNIALPFLNSHVKMAPLERIKDLKALDFSKLNAREAAVLVLIYPKFNETYMVLIERNEYKGVHSKQISLPGGKKESFDIDLKATAIRETEEEIGVKASNIDILTNLSPVYVPASNFVIHSFLGISKIQPDFKPDIREVKNIIEVKLSDLLNPKIIKHQNINTSYANMIKVPYYELQGNMVWGATAMILSELIDIVNSHFK